MMKTRNWIRIAVIASHAAVAGPAVAADAGTTTSQAQTNPSAAGSVQGYMPYGPATVGGSERIDNSNAVPLDAWERDYAQTHGGNLPRVMVVERRAEGSVVSSPRYVTPEEARVIYIAPEDARAIYVAPEQPAVVYIAPSDARIVYGVPGESRIVYRWVTDPDLVNSPGGDMQATPGANGPASPKGQ
jgi:hypothetical protein